MGDDLTKDEFDALAQIGQGIAKHLRPSACVARNVKRLTGLKYAAYARDGHLGLTEKGSQTLFIHDCIHALHLLANDPATILKKDVAAFLGRKGHVIETPDAGFAITQKGRECLADIEART